MPSALAFVYPGCEPVELVGTVDVLRRCGVQVTLYAHTSIVEIGHGITIKVDTTEKPTQMFDCLILPGGMGWKNLQNDEYAKELATHYIKENVFVCAICAAPAVALGHWGLIKGKHATCYPGMEKMGLDMEKFSEERVVVDGKLITARGPGVSLEFGLQIAKSLGCNSEDVKKGMLVK
ncbi:Protein_deglycase [Hexamita inflata]|uniref:Protein_deglycase n=1 Tax=Hexamita inflata TaxID=28002 RepID=A0ABP1H8M8_9EUKA